MATIFKARLKARVVSPPRGLPYAEGACWARAAAVQREPLLQRTLKDLGYVQRMLISP